MWWRWWATVSTTAPRRRRRRWHGHRVGHRHRSGGGGLCHAQRRGPGACRFRLPFCIGWCFHSAIGYSELGLAARLLGGATLALFYALGPCLLQTPGRRCLQPSALRFESPAPSSKGLKVARPILPVVLTPDFAVPTRPLEQVWAALDLSRATYARIRLNFVWAMGYNVINHTPGRRRAGQTLCQSCLRACMRVHEFSTCKNSRAKFKWQGMCVVHAPPPTVLVSSSSNSEPTGITAACSSPP